MDELWHYGVKGMKWGVRKADYSSMNKQQKKAAKKEYKSDKKWFKKNVRRRTYNESYDRAINRFNSELPQLNKKIKPTTDARQVAKNRSAYLKRFNSILSQEFESVARTISPSGKYRVDMLLEDFADTPYMTFSEKASSQVALLKF